MELHRISWIALAGALATAGACAATPGLELRDASPRRATSSMSFDPSLAGAEQAPLVPARAPREGSAAIALARRGPRTIALVAHGTEDAVVTVDVETRTVVDVTPLAGRPEQLLVMGDGRVLATLRGSGELAVLEANAAGHLEEVERVHVGSDPFAVAASPDGKRLYVTCGFEGSIVALDGATLERVFAVSVAREPRGVLVSEDGHRIFASHATASFVTSIDVEYPGAPRVQRAPLGVEEQEFLIGPGLVATGFFADQGFAIVERAGRIYVPGAFKDPGPHEFTGGYGAHAAPIRPTVRTVDMVAFAPVSNDMGVSRFSDVGNECTLPRAAALDDAEHLYVACLGIDQVLELDARSVDPSTGLMRRFDVPEGPTGVAVDGARRQLVTYSSIAGSVGFVDLESGKTVELGLPMRVEPTLSAAEKRGRHLFSSTRDARIALDNRACESCHPDGRDDGMTWSTPDGPRQTISLAGRISGPGHFGWFGNNGTVALHVRHTAKRLHGAGFEGGGTNADDLAAIEAWLHAMPAPSPTVAADDPAAIEGARIFAARGCDGCHRDGATDDRAHDVHTGNVEEASLRFDTPSLRLVSASAPFFHDGRFATLDAMFLSDKGPMAMPGSTAEERSAVSRYLASLGSANVRPAPSGAFTEGGAARAFSPSYPDDFRAKVLTRSQRGERDVGLLDLATIPVASTTVLEARQSFTWDELHEMTPERFASLGELLDPTRDGARMADKGILRFEPIEVYGSDDIDDHLDWRDLRGGGRYRTFSWARIDHAAGGGLRFRGAVGVADSTEGVARLVSRVDGPTLSVCDGRGLVIRTTCATCEKGRRDMLLLVTRDHRGLRQDTMGIEKGQSGRLVAEGYELVPPKGVSLEYQSRTRISIDATHMAHDSDAKLSLACSRTDVDGGIFLF